MSLDFDVRGQHQIIMIGITHQLLRELGYKNAQNFFTGGSIIMDSGWLKHLNDGFISYKHIAFHVKRH